MPSTKNIILEFKSMNKKIAILSKLALGKASADLINAFQDNSPVGSTGDFRRSWDFSPSKGPGIVAGVDIFNNRPYAEPLEFGSPKGGLPWPNARERTVEEDGRIYSKQAIGGVIQPILDDSTYINSLVNEIRDFIFGEI